MKFNIKKNNDKEKVKESDPASVQLSWEHDLVLQERRSRQLAWRVAFFTGTLAMLSIIALVIILPLKQVVPYIVKVDDVSGDASIIQSAASYVQGSDINDKHWLKRYVIAHDRYDYYLLQADFDLVKKLSAENTFGNYASQFSDPIKIQDEYKDKVTIIPEILSITITRKGYATIRYQVNRRVDQRSNIITEKRVATVSYSYDTKKTGTPAEMIDNPLGFTVTGFQTEVEFKINETTGEKS